MERQAVYDLLKCFLEKRGVLDKELSKELAGLLAFGVAKGCFADPNTVFDDEEWGEYGNKLWLAALDDDKTAKRLGKHWRVVTNGLKQYQAEQKAAHAAAARLTGSKIGSTGGIDTPTSVSPYPVPPAVNKVYLPASTVSAEPPAPNQDILKITSKRHKMWRLIAEQAAQAGDQEAASALSQAFPVIYTPAQGGGMAATLTTLDWKLLSQLRATVSESGIRGEPTRQMLNYIWGGNILLPSDIKSIMRLILTQHQQLLFNAHWQAVSQESVAIIRQPGDPLHGITLEELMGLGAYMRTEAQALLGPEKLQESMKLARMALDRIKAPGGIPSYMSIKQGREESFGSFIDRVAGAIQTAGVADYMKGALLKQCAIQNCNTTTRNIIITLPGNWSIEESLERMSQVPSGPQAMVVDAIKEFGASITEQAKASHTQVLAALAPLQASMQRPKKILPIRCFRCGTTGHMRRDCTARNVWCHKCRSNMHNTAICRRGSGNGKSSVKGPRATTQVVSPNTSANAFPVQPQPTAGSNQPSVEVSDWTWQQQ
ncbi:GAK19 protein, partial [Nyctiprogne leucopyga]|nr:GAK19 protein [Nyctiprogne leucopyga]